MSLRGEINKVIPAFRKSVQGLALQGQLDTGGGAWGTKKIYGYVCDVHKFDDPDESLRGTIDVQEFGYGTYSQYFDKDDYIDGAGHHVGVLLSAINKNKDGVWLMPMMYSEVIITQDPQTMKEYVLMYSHVDVVHLQSHQTIQVGVVETEKFKEGPDGPDFEELPETGKSAVSDYDKDKIVDTIKTKSGTVTIKRSIDGVVIDANGKTNVKINSDGSVVVNTQAKAEFTGGQLIKRGTCTPDGQGGFCGIPVCPFTGAVHVGTTITE